MKKPIIAISGSIIKEKQGEFANYPRSYVNDDYVQAVALNGGIPLIIPVTQNLKDINAIIESVDGLILSGGHDVYPYHYGQEPNILLGETFKERDLFEYELIRCAISKGMPILGICRGLQLLNTYFDGTLYQDLSLLKESLKHNQVSNPTSATHLITIDPHSELFEIFEENEVFVNSFHHQVIKDLGENLIVSAMSSDGVIEAIENQDLNILAVQFHPEMMFKADEKMNRIFEYFIEKVKTA